MPRRLAEMEPRTMRDAYKFIGYVSDYENDYGLFTHSPMSVPPELRTWTAVYIKQENMLVEVPLDVDGYPTLVHPIETFSED